MVGNEDSRARGQRLRVLNDNLDPKDMASKEVKHTGNSPLRQTLLSNESKNNWCNNTCIKKKKKKTVSWGEKALYGDPETRNLTVERTDNNQQNVDQKADIELKRRDDAKKSHDEST